MINKAKILRFLGLTAAVTGSILVCGSLSEASAQTRDPFAKPGWARTRDFKSGMPGKSAAAIINLGAPAIEQRIEYYKRMRETAAASGQPLPKVTSVLTLGEMTVTGIFRTPRGYAAMVEATPIKLSYTIYPGEKFFDGQLVAVEENRLVFRRVTKMSNGKFVASVENKALRQYTTQEVVQGTAPVRDGQPVEPARPVETAQADAKPATITLVSPLEEMTKQSAPDSAKEKGKKSSKKPVKVARNK